MNSNAAAAAAASAALYGSAPDPPPVAGPLPPARATPGHPLQQSHDAHNAFHDDDAFGYHEQSVRPVQEPEQAYPEHPEQPPAGFTGYAMDDDDPFGPPKETSKPPSLDPHAYGYGSGYDYEYSYPTNYPPSPDQGPGGQLNDDDEDDAFALEPAGPSVPSAHADYGLQRPGSAHPDAGGYDAEASARDGVYPPSMGRPVERDRLNDAQQRVFDSFPKNLDKDSQGLRDRAKSLAKNWRQYVQWKYWHYYLIGLILLILVCLITIFHTKIVHWLNPVTKKIRDLPAGWLIPVALLFILSFPPLFGHEIVGILCGMVWGLWKGFGIVAFGTLLGEIGNYFAFKSFLSGHARQLERKNIDYACMAHIVREGGLWIIVLARLSAIPGHFTTAVFATVGMGFWIFLIGCILSMPKQLEVVYLGLIMEKTGGGETTSSKVIKYIVLIVGIALTIGAMLYIYRKMAKVRPMVQAVLRDRRYRLLVKARTSDPMSNPKVNLDDVDPEGKMPEPPKPDNWKERIKVALIGTRGQPVLPTTQGPNYQPNYQMSYPTEDFPQSTYEPRYPPAYQAQGLASPLSPAQYPSMAMSEHQVPATQSNTTFATQQGSVPTADMVVQTSPELQIASLHSHGEGGAYDAPGARIEQQPGGARYY